MRHPSPAVLSLAWVLLHVQNQAREEHLHIPNQAVQFLTILLPRRNSAEGINLLQERNILEPFTTFPIAFCAAIKH